MLYTILIFRDFIFKENALFTYFVVLFLCKTVKTTESILNSDDREYPFLIFRLFVFVPHFVDVYVYAGTINRPLRLLTVCQNAANNLSITQHSPTKHVANIPSGVGTDSSRPYPDITKYTYPFQQIRIFTLLNMCFRSPFRGCLCICGHDKSAPTAADGLPKCCKQPVYNATFTHETRGEHSVRRRGRFIAPVSLYYQIYIFVSTNTHFHIIKYAFPSLILWVYTYMRAR